jgi:hypothetical protein
LRFKDVFDYTYVSETLNGTHGSAADLAKSKPLGPVEATKLPNGKVYHKVCFELGF